jgi:hypothetical protein
MLEDENKETNETTETKPAETKTQGSVWSDDYVKGLREEAKMHRLAKKSVEGKLKALIGLKDDEDVDDAKIAAYKDTQSKAANEAISKANARLIAAEIKGLDGYDTKLVAKLIDHSKITIADDGTVKGITEQLPELEKEFPAIKAIASGSPANPPGASNSKTLRDEYDEALAEAFKNPRNEELKRKVFLLGERLRQE